MSALPQGIAQSALARSLPVSNGDVTASETDQVKKAWYVIHTKPRQEDLALLNLERQGYECYLPKLAVEKIRRRKAVDVIEVMFPRYLFVRLEMSLQGKSWAPIRSTLGVSQMVSFGGSPAVIADALIEELQSREKARPLERLFEPGDRVMIVEGAFAGIEAVYAEHDAEKRAMILLEMLSKPVKMRVHTEALRKVP